jgi:hypothetical protein
MTASALINQFTFIFELNLPPCHVTPTIRITKTAGVAAAVNSMRMVEGMDLTRDMDKTSMSLLANRAHLPKLVRLYIFTI